MTVLVLVELDGKEPADASLRAISTGRTLGDVAAVVFAEAEKFPRFDEQTGPFTYARLQCSREDLPNGYTDAELDGWADQCRAWAEGGRDVFVFFISGAKVRNPAAAQALIARLQGG